MMKGSRQLGLLLIALTLAGCASTGGAQAHVTRQIGTSPRGEIDSKTRLVLQRNQYVMRRDELETNLYYETEWRARQPFDDERELGAREAESRIIVRARPRAREQNIYAASITVENRLMMTDGEWATPPATPEFQKYARRIADDLARELIQGIRVR